MAAPERAYGKQKVSESDDFYVLVPSLDRPGEHVAVFADGSSALWTPREELAPETVQTPKARRAPRWTRRRAWAMSLAAFGIGSAIPIQLLYQAALG